MGDRFKDGRGSVVVDIDAFVGVTLLAREFPPPPATTAAVPVKRALTF